MAQLGGVFDASKVDPNAGFDVIPAGKYIAQIIKSDMLPTSDGQGQFLKLEYEIIEGEFKGRRLWNNLNLVNNSALAVEIAQRDLSAICHAVGEIEVSDSEQLHFKPLLVTVKVRPAGKDKKGIEHNAQNEIGGHARASDLPLPTARPATQAVARPAPAPAKAPPPWAKSRAA